MDKFEKLVHYVCEKTKGDPSRLGATKLNKVLWYSDVFAYLTNGKSITEEVYVKRQYGPVPNSILTALGELANENKIAIRRQHFHGYQQKQYISLTEADDSFLSELEKKIVDDVIKAICENHTAISISDLTHDELYHMAKEGEEIPLCAIFSHKAGCIKSSDIEWAKKLVA